jgi:sirohydrochlorin ferrochelatase
MADQLRDEFGINAADWTRLRFIFERHLMGDKAATHLVHQLDLGRETPTSAKRLLQEAMGDGELVGNMTKIRLPDMRQQVLHFGSYVETVGAALRLGIGLNQGHMTSGEIAELCSLLGRLGANTIRVADLLTRATTGGSTADDR